VLDGLRRLRPTADVVELPGVEHYPQVEVPEVFADLRSPFNSISRATLPLQTS
jgi:pimeloyl-ACP methyl ester carboxylesterase